MLSKSEIQRNIKAIEMMLQTEKNPDRREGLKLRMVEYATKIQQLG